MLFKNLKIVSLLLFFMVSSHAYAADEGWYIGGSAGVVLGSEAGIDDNTISVSGVSGSFDSSLDLDTGFTVSGVLGYRMKQPLRVELEGFYRKADGDEFTVSGPGGSAPISVGEIDTTVTGAMVNAAYDIDVFYLLGGIGIANLEFDDGLVSDDGTDFAWQIGAGVGYALDENMIIDLKYRYFNIPSLDSEPVSLSDGTDTLTFGDEIDFSAHLVEVGIRYNL